ncbi:MAG: hypothetical protein WD512_03345 [Candidatus Paceibacterota bacterium]
MKDNFIEGEYNITKESIQIMLKAFSCGTRFVITSEEWDKNIIEEEIFWARYYRDAKTGLIYIRVSNDERRRLIPVLKRLQKVYLKKK